MRRAKQHWQAGILLSTAICTGSLFAQAAGGASSKFTTLKWFNGKDGAQPDGTLILDRSCALYGTTLNGGAHNLGTVFQLAPPGAGATGWTLNVLHSFAGGSDGASTLAAVVFDEHGALYGATTRGGASNSGVVFRLTPPTVAGGAWTETVLYSFTGGSDGAFPYSALVFDPKGALYGTAYSGGAYNKGTVFQLTPPSAPGGVWTETVLHSFTGRSGANSFAGLVFGADGALYGTTSGGGAHNLGTVFQVTPPAMAGGAWKETVIYSFASNPDGATPYDAVVFAKNGNLYGTTFGGGTGYGTVFEMAPPSSTGGAWTETVLHAFGTGTDGSRPFASLVFGPDGGLISTTAFGGYNNGGTVFGLKPPSTPGGAWSEVILQNLGALAQPGAGLTPAGNGVYYGLTYGASPPDFGSVFQLTL